MRCENSIHNDTLGSTVGSPLPIKCYLRGFEAEVTLQQFSKTGCVMNWVGVATVAIAQDSQW